MKYHRAGQLQARHRDPGVLACRRTPRTPAKRKHGVVGVRKDNMGWSGWGKISNLTTYEKN
jgi:hypothetical protein